MFQKFRVWNFQERTMEIVTSIHWSIDGYVAEVITNEQEYFEDELESNIVYIMQSTGVLDKNGKEIYEGDILHCKEAWVDNMPNYNILGEVYYSNRGTWDCESFLLGGINEDSEVVGNIYENPELMEAE